MSAASNNQSLNKEKLFQFFKYTIYLLLFANIFYWLHEDYQASVHTFRDGIGWQQIGDAFSQAMDTIAWFILLIAFELETYAMSDDQLRGKRKILLNTIAGICYFMIVIAFLGYVGKFHMAFNFGPSPFANACDAVGHVLAYAVDLDAYLDLNAVNCLEIGTPIFVNESASILADQAMLTQLHWLASAEALNGGIWILIVLLLWIDVFIQLKGIEHGKLYRVNLVCKFVLYAALIVLCIYWGIDGNFMDFWDAFLWIIAFFFIEMNIFKWAEEIEAENEAEQIEIERHSS